MDTAKKLELLEDAVSRLTLIYDVLSGKQHRNAQENFVLKYLDDHATRFIAVALGHAEQVEKYYEYAVIKGKTAEKSNGIADIALSNAAYQLKVVTSDKAVDVTSNLTKAAGQLTGIYGEEPGHGRRRAIYIRINSEDNPWPDTTWTTVPTASGLRNAVATSVKAAIQEALTLTRDKRQNSLGPYLQGRHDVQAPRRSPTSSRAYGTYTKDIVTQQQRVVYEHVPIYGLNMFGQLTSFTELQPRTITEAVTQQIAQPFEAQTVVTRIRWPSGRLVVENGTVKAIYGYKLSARFNNPNQPIVTCSVVKTYGPNDDD
ncbi:MAG: hypothetical protein WCZ23_13605 [Rhodospirillaceae bacterium]